MSYPASLDSFTPKTDNVDNVVANDVNELQTAIVNIETELGTDPAGSAADLKTRLKRALSDAGLLNFEAATELTINAGAITITQNYHRVDTEDDDATDDLDTINGGAAGMMLILRQENSARDVTLRHGIGNIRTSTGANLTLGTANSIAILIYDGALSAWVAHTGGGSGGGIEVLYKRWDPDCPPETPHEKSDEFDDADFDTDLWMEVDLVGSNLEITEGDYGLSIKQLGGGSGEMSGVFAECATGDFTIAAKLSCSWNPDTMNEQTRLGLALVDGLTGADTGVTISVRLSPVSATDEDGPVQLVAVETWAKLDGSSGQTLAQQYKDNSGLLGRAIYFRIRYDSSVYYFDYSFDGLGWYHVYGTGSLGITPTHWGICVGTNDEVGTAYAHFFRVQEAWVDVSTPLAGRRVNVFG